MTIDSSIFLKIGKILSTLRTLYGGVEKYDHKLHELDNLIHEVSIRKVRT